MSRVARFLLELLTVTVLGLSILSTLMFTAANPPSELGRSGGCPPMPADWEAGVCNHGSYIQWYLIRNHPFVFALSIAGIIAGGFGLQQVRKKL